jgi:hypothetical protein
MEVNTHHLALVVVNKSYNFLRCYIVNMLLLFLNASEDFPLKSNFLNGSIPYAVQCVYNVFVFPLIPQLN